MSKKKKTPKTKSEVMTFSIERIDWNDHWSGSDGWCLPEQIKTGPLKCVSVGVVIREDKDGITLAQSMGTNFKVADPIYIIKKCVTSRAKLGTVEYGEDKT